MTTNTNTIEKSRTYYLVINALFIALTLVATWLINIRLPFMGSGEPDPSGQCASFRGGNAVRQKDRSYRGSFRHGAVRPHERMDRMGAIHVYYRRLHGLRGRSSGRKEAV